MSVTLSGMDARSSSIVITKSRARLYTLLALFIGSVVGLLLAEYSIRILAPQSLISDIIAPDPDIDYRLRPGSVGHMVSQEYSADIHINSLGFRGPEVSLSKPEGITRVLFLGDSFVFGHGLADTETLPFLVGQELERAAPGRFEVINGGVYGYSTADELAFFEKFGISLKPDIVATLFLFPNDVADNAAVYKIANDGSLIKQKLTSYYSNSRNITRFIPGANWLRAHSHLFKFVGVRLLPVIRSGLFRDSQAISRLNAGTSIFGASAAPAQDAPHSRPDFYVTKGGPFKITASILAKLATDIKNSGARPILLSIGEADEYNNGRLKPRALLFHEHFSQTAISAGFPVIVGLSQILERYPGKDKLYFPEDAHWTAAATKFVAPEVARLIHQSQRNNAF